MIGRYLWRHWNTIQVVDPSEDLGKWPSFDGGLDAIPVGRREMIGTYGNPRVTYGRRGKVKVSRKWERENMVLAKHLPGVPHRDGRLYCHRLVEPYLREALRRAQIVCPDYKIETIGCFSPRHQRHDRGRPLSDHTWGVAVDINAARNRPGAPGDMPSEFVRAFTSVSFDWGGGWRGWPDKMHFSLRRIR